MVGSGTALLYHTIRYTYGYRADNVYKTQHSALKFVRYWICCKSYRALSHPFSGTNVKLL
jgi:hypothetical protein